MERKKGLLEIIKEKLEEKNYSEKTQKNYRWWIKKYIIFHGRRNPMEMNEREIKEFIASLSQKKRVSAVTTNQAIDALCFLYEEVLDVSVQKELKKLRVKREEVAPVILDKEELHGLFYYLKGIYKLMATLMYGCGLSLSELISLKIKDIDFKLHKIWVDGRIVPLPMKISEELRLHVKEMKRLHGEDLRQGYGYQDEESSLPREFSQQYPFVMRKLSLNEEKNQMQRVQVSDKTFTRNIKKAAADAMIEKRVTPSTLRHSYALHMLQNGVDKKSLQKLMGVKSMSSLSIYSHILREQNSQNLLSPLDIN